MLQKIEKEIMASWKNDYGSSPIVSVRCMTYNHEKYIENTLDSFLMQETNFPFEIIVHDDCSTDKTPDIIRQYEKKYPHIIKVIYQSENQYSQPGGMLRVRNMLREICCGKYIAICEGDDYWMTTDKLQRQYEALNDNSSIEVCVCKTYIKKGENEKNRLEQYIPNEKFKNFSSNIINSEQLAEYVFGEVSYPFHTSSYFYTKKFEFFDDLESLRNYTEGDEVLLRKAIALGGVYYIDEVMSCYRWLATGGWTEEYLKKSSNEQYIHAKNQVIANQLFNEIIGNFYDELIQKKNFKLLIKWMFKVDTKMVLDDINEMIGKEIIQKMDSKEKIAYILASINPKLANGIYKIYSKLKG